MKVILSRAPSQKLVSRLDNPRLQRLEEVICEFSGDADAHFGQSKLAANPIKIGPEVWMFHGMDRFAPWRFLNQLAQVTTPLESQPSSWVLDGESVEYTLSLQAFTKFHGNIFQKEKIVDEATLRLV